MSNFWSIFLRMHLLSMVGDLKGGSENLLVL
jgi:hypothetical protein